MLSDVMAGAEVCKLMSCLAKSLSSQANKIACFFRLNGSHMNSPRGRGGTSGGRISCKGSTVDAQDEWMAVMMQQSPTIMLPRSG